MIPDKCPHPSDGIILLSWDYSRGTCWRCDSRVLKLWDNKHHPVLRWKATRVIVEWP